MSEAISGLENIWSEEPCSPTFVLASCVFAASCRRTRLLFNSNMIMPMTKARAATVPITTPAMALLDMSAPALASIELEKIGVIVEDAAIFAVDSGL